MTYLKPHLFWIILIGVSLLIGRLWLSERDERMKTEADLKQAAQTVTELQKQIETRDAASARQVQAITRKAATVKTPQQAIDAIPDVSNLPVRAIPNDPSMVAVPALALYAALETAKVQGIALEVCKTDLQAEKGITVIQAKEITELKKKPRLFTRIKHGAELVGIGLGIGIMIAGHL